MRTLFRFFGKLIAGILVLVFIISAFTSIFLLALNSQLFSPDFYLEVFDEVELFDHLPEIASTQIKYTMGFNPCREDPTKCEGDGPQETETSQGGPPSYFQALSEKDWELLLEGLLPPEWLEDQVLAVTGGLFESIDQGSGEISIKISLIDLKERLGGEAGVEAIVQLLDAQPECSKEDLLNMTRILEGKEQPGGDFLNCQPPEDFIEKYTPQLEVLLRRSLRDVPEEIDLGEGIFGDESSSKDASIKLFGTKIPILAFVKWIRWAINMSPLACLLLLVVIAFFGVFSFKALSSWWGYPLAISGLMGLGISLLVGPAVDFFSSSFLKNREFTGFSPILIDTGSDLVVGVIRSLFLQARNYSLIIFGIGLAVIITTAILKPPTKKDPQAEEGEEEPEDEVTIPDSDIVEVAPDVGEKEPSEQVESSPDSEEKQESEDPDDGEKELSEQVESPPDSEEKQESVNPEKNGDEKDKKAEVD
jgi:hypothetical protein